MAVLLNGSWTHGDGSAVVCTLTTGNCVGVGGGSSLFTAAVCNDVADVKPALDTFNTWAVGTWQASHSGLIELVVPSNSVCFFQTFSQFAKGINKLRVVGYGATFTDNNGAGSGYNLGGDGVCQKGIADAAGCTARINTANSGDTSITLTSSSLSSGYVSRFTSGQWVVVAGFDMIGSGYPPNPAFFDYAKITNVNAGTGVISLDRPLTHQYKSTWPLYFAGNSTEADQGGPATIYALAASWDADLEYRGLTLSSFIAINNNGRSVTYRDVTFSSTQSNCAIPSQNLLWQIATSNMSACVTEVDKIVDTVSYVNSTVGTAVFQSAGSIKNLVASGLTIGFLTGTPKTTTISNSTIGAFKPGATAYGSSQSFNCTTCSITSITGGGVVDKGIADAGVNNSAGWSMSGGVITIPHANGPRPWTVPGANNFWQGAFETETSFQIVDVSTSGSNDLITTSLAGGFPPVETNAGALYILTHAMPSVTCTACSGGIAALDLNQAPAGAPIFSYMKETYTSVTATSDAHEMWGKLKTINANISGAFGSGTINLFGQFKASGLDPPNYSADTAWNPSLNATSTGLRAFDIGTGWSGTKAGDTLTNPGAVWFSGSQAPYASPDIGGGSFTLELITDHGVVNP